MSLYVRLRGKNIRSVLWVRSIIHLFLRE